MSSKGDDLLQIMRHSAAHLMASAILKLYPKTKFGIGPSIENGFYYDIETDEQISIKDLEKIEKTMQKLKEESLPYEKSEMTIDEAIEKFGSFKQEYKVELLNDIKNHGTTIKDDIDQNVSGDNNGKVTIYRTGHFIDLCRGPHLENTSQVGFFKLTKVSGAYWRGDEKNKMLTRIYGVVFEKQEELDQYIKMIEEAEKRDHRKLGKELDLFHIDEQVGLGLPLWHPNGAIIWRMIEDFWYDEHLKNGYDLVRSPHIGNRILWETSGHWNFYNDSMYPPMEVGQSLSDLQNKKDAVESEQFLLKPMNCPFHVRIYKNKMKSYREFPLRWAECGTVYRFEKKGQLSGLTRVRGFTQDDAHIICRKDQVEDELKRVVDFILFIFKSFGFETNQVKVYLSLRDPNNTEKYAGNDDGWKFTQEVLEKVAKEMKLDYITEEGEAAFYGPKIDFKLKDCLGREWQCSTLQFDFNLPERFDMTFTNNEGQNEQAYMLHRALFGSFERFIGLLIEHYAGAFPVWLAPHQVAILSVSKNHVEAAQKLADMFRQKRVRVLVNNDNETVGYKIRSAEKMKVPYMIVVGDKEADLQNVAVRKRGEKETITMSVNEFIDKIVKENQDKVI